MEPMQWYPTSTINKRTKRPNIMLFDGKGLHAVVYEREYGYAFTVRGEQTNGHWIQDSSKKNFNTEDEAKTEALVGLFSLQKLLMHTPLVITRPKHDVEAEIAKLTELLGMDD